MFIFCLCSLFLLLFYVCFDFTATSMYYSRIHAQTYANLLFFEQKRARMLGFLCLTPDISIKLRAFEGTMEQRLGIVLWGAHR